MASNEYARNWYARNIEHCRKRGRENKKRYRARNRERLNEMQRLHRKNNPEVWRAYKLKHDRIHAEEMRERRRKENADPLVKAKRNAARKKKILSDPNFRLRTNLSKGICQALHRGKSITTAKLLGCSIESLWMYLESKFQPGMTRDNYGRVWHIDHIMPCAIFDLTKPEHQKRCFHFSNLQPLFALDNQIKSDKIITNQFQLI